MTISGGGGTKRDRDFRGIGERKGRERDRVFLERHYARERMEGEGESYLVYEE